MYRKHVFIFEFMAFFSKDGLKVFIDYRRKVAVALKITDLQKLRQVIFFRTSNI